MSACNGRLQELQVKEACYALVWLGITLVYLHSLSSPPCRELILDAGEPRRAGLAMLVQFMPQLLLPLPGQAPLLGDPADWLADGAGEAAHPMPMWQLLRECLVSAQKECILFLGVR